MYCGKLLRTTVEYSLVKSKVQGALSLGLVSFSLVPIPPPSLMTKMVPFILQTLIQNANRMRQVQEDINGKLIEKRCVDMYYMILMTCIFKERFNS